MIRDSFQASSACAYAARYFAMMYADRESGCYEKMATDELRRAADAMGFDLVQREPAKLEAAE